MNQGFPKSRRLLRRKDFRIVYDNGTMYRNSGFQMFVRPRENPESETRVGLTATRRLGSAVVRNRIRRWTRETVRQMSPPLTTGYDLVVNYHPRMGQAARPEFDRLFKDVVQKAHLIAPSDSNR